MKHLFTTIIILVSFTSYSQRGKYNKVDTVIIYNNASIVVYNRNGLTVRDSIFRPVTINYAKEVIIMDEKLTRSKQ